MKRLPYIQTASRAAFVLGVFLWTLTCISQVCWAQQSPRQRAAALCDSASACLERGEVEEAYRLFGQALRLDRDFPRALLGMGRAMLEMPKRGGRALEYIKRAVALEPRSKTLPANIPSVRTRTSDWGSSFSWALISRE